MFDYAGIIKRIANGEIAWIDLQKNSVIRT